MRINFYTICRCYSNKTFNKSISYNRNKSIQNFVTNKYDNKFNKKYMDVIDLTDNTNHNSPHNNVNANINSNISHQKIETTSTNTSIHNKPYTLVDALKDYNGNDNVVDITDENDDTLHNLLHDSETLTNTDNNNDNTFIADTLSSDSDTDSIESFTNSSSKKRQKRRKLSSDNLNIYSSIDRPNIANYKIQYTTTISNDYAKHMDECILQWLTRNQTNQYDIKLRNDTVNRARSIVQSSSSNIDIRVFGSQATGTYIKNSDIDLGIINGSKDDRSQLRAILKQLYRCKFASNILPVLTAKVPIIKYHDKLSNIDVDISIYRHSGHNTVGWVNKAIDKYIFFKPLLLILKTLLCNAKVDMPVHGGMGSHLLQCLLVAHLYWHSQYKTNNTTHNRLSTILLHFFEFFIHFDFYNYAIQIDDSYSAYIVDRPHNTIVNNRPMCMFVHDPCDIGNNVGRSCYDIDSVLDVLSRARNDLLILQNNSKINNNNKIDPIQTMLDNAIVNKQYYKSHNNKLHNVTIKVDKQHKSTTVSDKNKFTTPTLKSKQLTRAQTSILNQTNSMIDDLIDNSDSSGSRKKKRKITALIEQHNQQLPHTANNTPTKSKNKSNKNKYRKNKRNKRRVSQ